MLPKACAYGHSRRKDAPLPSRPRGSVEWQTGCLGALVGLPNVSDGRVMMQKESRVALVRHHPEAALSATRRQSAHAVVILTVAKRA